MQILYMNTLTELMHWKTLNLVLLPNSPQTVIFLTPTNECKSHIWQFTVILESCKGFGHQLLVTYTLRRTFALFRYFFRTEILTN